MSSLLASGDRAASNSRFPRWTRRGNEGSRSVDNRTRCGQLPTNNEGAHRGGPPHYGFDVGGVLLSHTLSSAVPSALEGLASGFGMGPGVPPPPKPPTTLFKSIKP